MDYRKFLSLAVALLIAVSTFSVAFANTNVNNDNEQRRLQTIEPLNLAGEAIRDGKLMEARRILHNLRGSIGNLGAKRFVAASLALELALQEGRIVEVPILFTALEGELKLVHDHAGAWLDQHSGRAAVR